MILTRAGWVLAGLLAGRRANAALLPKLDFPDLALCLPLPGFFYDLWHHEIRSSRFLDRNGVGGFSVYADSLFVVHADILRNSF